MTTVVFGGTGFVGLNIVEALLEKGEPVTVFDVGDIPDAARMAFDAPPGRLSMVKGDVRRPEDIAQAFAGKVDTVVYGAAVTAGLERDRKNPERTLDVNLSGMLNAIRVARDNDVRRLVNLSSAGAYGAAAFGSGLLDEGETIADPQSIYSITKFASERIVDRMAEVWSMDLISVRLSAVFGRWERQTAVRDTPSPQYQIMRAALDGQPAIIERRDSRDWIYAPDVARAIIALRDADTLNHRLYNVSTGTSWPVVDWGLQLAQIMPGFECRVAKPGETPTIELHAPRDRKQLSIERLVADTGFAARYGIDQSVADYQAWASDIGSSYP